MCYNAVDRHVEAGRGDQTAIIHDSPVTHSRQSISYRELLDQVTPLCTALPCIMNNILISGSLYTSLSDEHPFKNSHIFKKNKTKHHFTDNFSVTWVWLVSGKACTI